MSEMEKWLRKQNMTTLQFSKIIGCSRIVIWKVKVGKNIRKSFSEKILQFTQGQVISKTYTSKINKNASKT